MIALLFLVEVGNVFAKEHGPLGRFGELDTPFDAVPEAEGAGYLESLVPCILGGAPQKERRHEPEPLRRNYGCSLGFGSWMLACSVLFGVEVGHRIHEDARDAWLEAAWNFFGSGHGWSGCREFQCFGVG